ncbi:carbohydrate ABC transporter permease [Moorella naiadis]|uniref:carbohydrate ABC transporter permease n=1 Tax=Moorella naiadis (nom. illeg.) TaxID=3093670 RepID=UPI003D9C8E5F
MRNAIKWALHLTTYLITGIMFFPLLWIFLNAFKTEADAYHSPPLFIFHPVLTNVINAFGGGEYLHFLSNSFIISIGSVIIANILGLPLAFYLAELKWNGKGDNLFMWCLSTRFMPAAGIIIPLYVIFNKSHLLDSIPGMLIIYIAISIPFIVVVMRSFFLDIPYSVVEAAIVEGAGFWQLFFRIILPMATPGIATSSILAIIFNWNEYFFAVNLSGTYAGTLPVYLASFMTSEGLFWARVSGIAVLAILPILILGWLAQNRIVRGLTLGAVKE